MSSGAYGFGGHSGAYNTYWNIYSSKGSSFVPLPYKPSLFVEKATKDGFGLNLNFVFNTDNTSKNNKDDSWYVFDSNRSLCILNLYDAMKDYTSSDRKEETKGIF